MNTARVPHPLTQHTAELSRPSANPVDKTDLVRRVFQQCCQRLSPCSAAAWTQLSTGELSLLVQRGEVDVLMEVRRDALSTNALQQSFGSRLPRQHVDASHRTVWNLPLTTSGFQPVVFSLAWNREGQQAELPTFEQLAELSQQLTQSLHQLYQQARWDLHTKWNRWRVSPASNTPQLGPGQVPPANPNPEPPERRVLQQLANVTESVAGMLSEGSLDSAQQSSSHIETIDSPPTNFSSLVQLAECVGRQLDQQKVAFDVANALQTYFGFGRISLCLLSGSKVKVSAISGIASFDTRSASVVSIKYLVQQILKSGQACWHPEQGDDLPEEVARALNQYYETTDSRSVAVIPVVEFSEMSADPNDVANAVRSERERRGRKLAAIVIEGVRQPVHRQTAEARWWEAERIVTNAISNAQRHSRIPLLPFWTTLADAKELFQGHHRNKALAITLAGVVLVLVCALVPYPLKLKAEGNIQPKLRSRVYAEVPGTIVDLPAAESVIVSAGDPVIQLASPELEIEYARVQGEYLETRQAAVAIRDQLNSVHSVDEASLNSLRKERAGLEERLRSLQGQYELLKTKRSKLCIRSPQAGQVITWDLNQRLSRRPVQTGQHLLTVADTTGPWELELIVPDRLTGYLRRAMQDKSVMDQPVDFVLASDPRQVYRGSLRQISDSFQIDDERGPVLRVYVDLGEDAADWLRQVKPGTEVMARIHTGNYPLGYCFFYEFFDWIKRQCFKYIG